MSWAPAYARGIRDPVAPLEDALSARPSMGRLRVQYLPDPRDDAATITPARNRRPLLLAGTAFVAVLLGSTIGALSVGGTDDASPASAAAWMAPTPTTATGGTAAQAAEDRVPVDIPPGDAVAGDPATAGPTPAPTVTSRPVPAPPKVAPPRVPPPPATTTPPAPPPPVTPVTDPIAENAVVALVNLERAKVPNCPGLALEGHLATAARRHSADMAARDYLRHDSPEGVGVDGRIADTGYRASAAGENIAQGHRTPLGVVRAWMRSGEQRANILNCQYRHIGVGLAFDDRRSPVWTQVFATPGS